MYIYIKELILIRKTQISKPALKSLRRAPEYIQQKFRAWLVTVSKIGLEETKKSPGWHDEPLKGDRRGQRSIRLNKQWRAIYIIKDQNQIEFVEIIEVTPHDY